MTTERIISRDEEVEQEASSIVAANDAGYALAPGCFYPWERLESESPQAYEAFSLYRDAGIGRSIVDVAKGLGKQASLLYRWSAANGWQDRANRYDIYIDRKTRLAMEARRVRMVEQHAETAARIMRIVDRWAEDKLRQIDTEGLEAIPESQIPALLKIASTVERQSLGLPAEAREVAHTHRVDEEQLERAVEKPVADWLDKLRERAAELKLLEAQEDVDGDTIEAEYRETEQEDGSDAG